MLLSTSSLLLHSAITSSASTGSSGGINIPSWILAVIAVYGVFSVIYPALHRLRMEILRSGVQYYFRGIALVLIRLAFVNPSSRYKTVVDVQPRSEQERIAVRAIPPIYHQGLSEISYKLASGEVQSLPISVSLQVPLDIPPHQSQSKWLAVSVKCGKKELSTIRLSLVAYASHDKNGRPKGKLATSRSKEIEQNPLIV
jgi:hypothetical protein